MAAWLAKVPVRCPSGSRTASFIGPTPNEALRKGLAFQPSAGCRKGAVQLVQRGPGAGARDREPGENPFEGSRRRRGRGLRGDQQNFFFTRKPKSNCGFFLKHWADQRGLRVRSTASVRVSAEEKKAPYSEMCYATGCAGKHVRAFVYNPKSGTAAIGYMDKGVCQFTSGGAHEVLPPGFWNAARTQGQLGGARRKRRRR